MTEQRPSVDLLESVVEDGRLSEPIDEHVRETCVQWTYLEVQGSREMGGLIDVHPVQLKQVVMRCVVDRRADIL